MRVRLVGRDAEIAVLAAAVAATAERDGRVVLLTGDPGIGKSRLASHTLRAAAERGFATLEGSAHPLHAGLAYAPVVQAIRRYLSDLPAHDSVPLLSGLADLGRLLDDPRLPPAPPLGDPELERTRMFEAVAQLIERIADRQPVALFVDDLHWADRGTIELVHYLGRGAQDRRILVLASYRSGEPESTALREFASAVRRHDVDTEIELRPLSDAAVAELVEQLAGGPVPAELLAGVTARARGIPLFVRALVQDTPRLRATTNPPAVVRDVVLGQLEQLKTEPRGLLDVVAVAGETSPEVLAAVWTGDLEAPLRELVGRGLLTEEVAGRSVRLRVGHPMYAEVAYAELTAADRRRLHAQLAGAIERLTPDDTLALAPHYLEAGDAIDAGRATEILATAGQRALSIHAAEEAVRYFNAALADARPDSNLLRRLELLTGLGRAMQECGQLAEAAAVWGEGLAQAQRAGLAEQDAALRYRLALLETERGNLTLADQHSRAGAAIASPGSGDAEALALRMVYSMRSGDPVRMRAAAEHTEALAALDPSPMVQAAASIGRSVDAWVRGDFRVARREAENGLEYGGGSPMIRATANRMLISMAVAAGDLAAATQHAQAGLDTLTESHLPSGMASTYYSLAMLRYLSGDLAGATAAADSGLETARRTSGARAIARLLLCRAFLLAEQGRGAEAANCIADAAQTHPLGTSGDTPVTAIWELSRMAVAHLMGRPQDAPEFTVVALNDDAIVMWLRPVYSTHTYLALGNVDAAATMVAKLREFGPVGRYVDALADRLDGLHSAATGSPDRALLLLSHAADEFAAMDMPVLASQARLEWAELSSGDPEIAEIVAGCLDVFQRSGAIPWVDRCRRVGRSLGVRITATRRAGELSNREAQVVQLVTDGLSNSQIAARLFLSERTVETHLRNVYARLGITSRVALVRWSADNPQD